ncbi:MAG: hypothetical protein B0D92_06345 [Spirochaeta sp. LUC14_002_19_P3]|nr:MAG: hypothetical protein B0D92_06345 [Spirochaeta sp. LUC14_002_19_P3]
MAIKISANIPSVRNNGIPRTQAKPQGIALPQTSVPPPSVPKIDKAQLKIALDNVLRNTRLQYDIKDEVGYFVVRIIDKDTDRVIREIPSRELQTVREQIKRVLGLLFDKKI